MKADIRLFIYWKRGPLRIPHKLLNHKAFTGVPVQPEKSCTFRLYRSVYSAFITLQTKAGLEARRRFH